MRSIAPAGHPDHEDYPAFDLHARFDDLADPAALTVYSVDAADDPTTAWLTVDADHVIPIEDLR